MIPTRRESIAAVGLGALLCGAVISAALMLAGRSCALSLAIAIAGMCAAAWGES